MRPLAILLGFSLLALYCQPTKKITGSPDPQEVVQKFIYAGMAMDREVLSQCFHEDSPGEWDDIRNKTISDRKLKELKEFVTGAEITGTEMTDWGAIVFVKFKSRNEEIKTVNNGSGWLIADF